MPSQSAPSKSSMPDPSEQRRPSRRRGVREYSCETCGKVYRHPNCLIKHRWEHNPHWRDAAQFLLSKHQQVQLMEAAAILIKGSSLPHDRALWPSVMSNGSLPSPAITGDGTPREKNPFDDVDVTAALLLASSPPTSTLGPPPSSHYDEDEDEDSQSDVDEDDKTDESDYPPSIHHYTPLSSPTVPVDIQRPPSTRARADARQSRAFSPYSSSPRPSLAIIHPASSTPHGSWGVITDKAARTPSMPILPSPSSDPRAYSEMRPSLTVLGKSAASPMAIPYALHARSLSVGQHSLSSLSSLAQSFSSTSSYLPSSSIRSADGEEDESDEHYVPHYRYPQFAPNDKSLRWSPPVQTPRAAVEDYEELEMDMD